MTTRAALLVALLVACGGDKGDADSGTPAGTTPTGTTAPGTTPAGTPAGTPTGTSGAETVLPEGVVAAVAPAMGTVITVSWTTPVETSGYVEFGVDGALDRATMETAAGLSHEVHLVGLPPETEVSYRVVVDSNPVDTETVTTGTLPGAPVLTVEGTGNDRFLALPLVRDDVSTATIVDPQGRVVWQYTDTRGLAVYRVHVKNDGSGIVYSATLVAGAPNEASVFVHVPWDGSSETEVPVEFLAHDFLEMDDGSLVSLAHEWRDELEGNKLISVAPDGTVTDLWSAWDCFDPALHPSIDPSKGWTHTNALNYDPVADVFMVSVRNLQSIVAVDRATGTCPWTIGGSAGDVEITGGLFLHQHQFAKTDGGLLVFDNDGAPGFESRVLEYTFDEVGKTADVARAIHADPPLKSFILGDVHRFDDGDTLVVWSVPGTVDRIAPDDTRTWRIVAAPGTVLGFTEALVDPANPALGVSR
ncbi:MAG: hypothetical protein ACI9K2_006210 [Myxococcota bacterium]|jgi:hypothetical protein